MTETTRRKLDFYETPIALTETLLAEVGVSKRAVILEPCAGDLAIVNVLRDNGLPAITNDIDGSRITDYHEDATNPGWWTVIKHKYAIDWVITNPPFNEAFAIAKNAVATAKVGVALLLRLTWLEPTKARGGWLRSHPPDKVIVFGSPRPSYTENGKTDAVTTAWVVWSKQTKPGFVFANNWKEGI